MQQFTPIPRILIEQELDRILSSKGFVNSPILCRFLRFIVDKALEGKEREIKEYTIGTEVLDKPSDFNRTTDPSVRIHAIRLRKQLEDYYLTWGQKAVVKFDIPKGSYIPVFSMFALENGSASHSGFLDKLKQDEGEWRDTLCILPFEELVRGNDDESVVHCFRSHLTSLFSRFQELKIIDEETVDVLLNNGCDLGDVAKQAGAKYAISGWMSLEGKEVQLTVKLHETASANMIWSNTYQVPAEEEGVMAVTQVLAKRVTAAIGGYTGVIFYRRYFSSREGQFSSYQHEALYYYYKSQISNTAKDYHKAAETLEALLKKHQECALMYSLLASLYADGIVYGYEQAEMVKSRAEGYAVKALAMEPENQHALFANAWLAVLNGDANQADDYVHRMIAQNPNSSFFNMVYAMGMCFLGNYQKSIEIVQEAMVNNPVPSWWIHVPHTMACLQQRDFNGLLFHAKKLGRMNTIFDSVFEIIAQYKLGNFGEMIKLVSTYYARFPKGLYHLRKTFVLVFHDEDLKLFLNECLAGIYRKSMEYADALYVPNRS